MERLINPYRSTLGVQGRQVAGAVPSYHAVPNPKAPSSTQTCLSVRLSIASCLYAREGWRARLAPGKTFPSSSAAEYDLIHLLLCVSLSFLLLLLVRLLLLRPRSRRRLQLLLQLVL